MSLGPVNGMRFAQNPADGVSKDSQKELRRAARDFESLFINQMLKSMRDTVVKSDLFHGGNAEEIYSSMLDTELSKSMADAGGIGLADMLLKQLSNGGGPAPVEPAKTGPEMTAPEVKAETAVQAASPAVIQTGEEEGFRFPLKELKRISSGFGERKDPFTGSSRFHHGMDIAANAGTPVFSAAPGKVIFSGKKGGYGNMIEILHDDGLVTRYGHNAENLVREGDTVSPSSPIARVGSTGRSTGPHLHFEVLRDGKAVDPESLYG